MLRRFLAELCGEALEGSSILSCFGFETIHRVVDIVLLFDLISGFIFGNCFDYLEIVLLFEIKREKAVFLRSVEIFDNTILVFVFFVGWFNSTNIL